MRIGITGSIACGKSAVSSYLRSKGYFVADADRISHELTSKDAAVLSEIRNLFGDDVFNNNSLDRSALANLVFSSDAALEKLNNLLHPLIIEQLERQLSRHEEKERIVFAEVPLLFECGMARCFDSIWVVSASEETQIARLLERNGSSREQALQRIRSQLPLSKKAEFADHVITTDGTISETHLQVDRLLILMESLQSTDPRAGRHTESNPSATAAGKPCLRATRARLSPFLYCTLLLLCIAGMSFLSFHVVRNNASSQIPRYELETRTLAKAFHPLFYKQLILSCSQRYDLDPALTASVILCESGFRSSAVSRLGARGLMQLMEETAEWIAGKLGENGSFYSFDLLFDPETNIRYGAWYLHYLSSVFGHDPVKTVCAYHAGQGNVASWLHNTKYSHDGQTLDSIPKEDTADYCNRVFAAKSVYEVCYDF